MDYKDFNFLDDKAEELQKFLSKDFTGISEDEMMKELNESLKELDEESQMAQPLLSEAAIPKQGGGEMSEDKILNSRLPDEIKKLMIEHPIQQPNSTGPTLSNDLIERASQLMNNGTGNSNVSQSNPKEVSQSQSQIPNNFREVLKEVVTEVLTDSGIISESSSKSNESFSFKVGKHIFEGKVVKIRKTK